MGVSRNPAELARKFDTAARQMQNVNNEAVARAAQVYKATVLAEAAGDVGGDLRMSWSGRNVRLGARYQVRKGPRPQAVLTPRPAGIWSALSSGTAPHEITPRARRKGRGRRKGGATALTVGDGFAASVQHPGTKGKRTWQRGITKAKPLAMTAFGQAHRRALVKVFQ